MVNNIPEQAILETGEIIKLSAIYSQIAVAPEEDFDTKEEKIFYEIYIERCFNSDFLKINNLELVRDVNRLNNSFVKLIKLIHLENNKFSDISKVFLIFCDYFDIPYNQTYINLHDKLKTKIQEGFIIMVGKRKFDNLEKKNIPNKPKTLFDLVAKNSKK